MQAYSNPKRESNLDDETIQHLYRWAHYMENDDDEAQLLAHRIIDFCLRHEFDPCAEGRSWPEMRALVEREAQS